VKTIGAGGGSIAWIDRAGVLHVGPQSAGASPGPAAYAKGGTHATVTDANLVMGRLNPNFFVGGQIELKRELANDVVESIGERLSLSREDAALGIIRISTSNMVQAIREVTVERGRDPRNFILVPFGGAGPTQAVDIAEALGIDSILVPRYPGITSAYGLICANLRVDLMRTVLLSEERETEKILSNLLKGLSARATQDLLAQGASSEKIAVEWSIDMRYAGQSHELNIKIPLSTPKLIEISRKLFEEEHESAFGYSMKKRAVEWVTVRVAAFAEQPDPSTTEASDSGKGARIGEREILLENGEFQMAEVFRRESLTSEQQLTGPTIIEQLDTTTYVGPGWSAEQQRNGALWMRRSVK
jgi:N-methylhydantoinase A